MTSGPFKSFDRVLAQHDGSFGESFGIVGAFDTPLNAGIHENVCSIVQFEDVGSQTEALDHFNGNPTLHFP